MSSSIDQWINEAVASGLIPAADLLAWLEAQPPAARPKSGNELARELVAQGKLTRFQAEQIHAGQGKSLALGNYLILDKLGQGGMGLVLKAMHRRMERVVALKVMSQAGMKSPDAVQRFHREVKAAAKLNHPNIVTAYDADEANGTHFLVMEYVEGTDLSALVKKQGPLPVEHAVPYILQAARGLEYAHSRGVIHRDIKPSNLLLSQGNDMSAPGPVIKILDMGLARIDEGANAQAELTTTGAVMGTVDYMAPEQALSARSADARSDIYSLGITLWYLLTGRIAYEGDSVMARLLAHRDVAIPSLADEFRKANRPAGAPPFSGASGTESNITPIDGSRGLDPPCEALDAVFRRMVAKRVEDRYQSMSEVIRDLERFLSGTAPFAASHPGRTPSVADTEKMPLHIPSPPLTGGRSDLSANGTMADPWGASLPASRAAAETIILPVEGRSTGPGPNPSQTTKSAGSKQRTGRSLLIGSIGAVVTIVLVILFSSSNSDGSRKDAVPGRLLGPAPKPVTTPAGSAPPQAVAPFDAGQARAHQEAWAKHLGTTVETTNSVGGKMVLIPPGEFLMGSTDEQIAVAIREVQSDTADQTTMDLIQRTERPQHRVVITKPFFMGATEVTLGQFKKFVAATGHQTYGETQTNDPSGRTYLRPGYPVTDDSPVSLVTWDEAVKYCNWLSELEQTAYRLPTEAEWEYACRAGTETLRSWGDSPTQSIRYAWTIRNSEMRPHPVATRLPNPFGLFDLHGNVSEWCEDRFDELWYAKSPTEDPVGSNPGAHTQSVRGGNWDHHSIVRSAGRTGSTHHVHDYTLGFRVVQEWNESAATHEVTPAQGRATAPAHEPADSQPPRAQAPFSPAQARRYQESWAKHLSTTVETTNSLDRSDTSHGHE